MKWICLYLAMLIAIPAPAKTSDWLAHYLKQKSFKCDLDDDQLTLQLNARAQEMVQRLTSALQARGVAYQSIDLPQDKVSTVVFPEDPVMDFSILLGVSVKIPGQSTESSATSPEAYTFQIQTTTSDAEVHKGLWIPIHLDDPGSDKPCTLELISVGEEHWNNLPVVDLMFGSRVAVSDIVQVKDISKTPTPEHTLKKNAEKPKEEVVKSKKKDSSDDDEPRRRHRSRRHRDEDDRPRRRHRRHEYRHHRHRHVDEAPAEGEPPPKADECAGDISVTQKLWCKIRGQ